MAGVVLTLRWTPRVVHFESRDPSLLDKLEAFLTIRNPKYEAEARYDPDAVEFFSLIDRPAGFFLPGVLARVLLWLEAGGFRRGVDFVVEDEPAPEPFREVPKDIVPGITLRPDQSAAVEACVSGRSGIVEMGTGSGKSEVAIALVLALGKPKTIMSVPDTTAQREIYRRFIARGFSEDEVGRVGGGYSDLSHPVVIAVMASLYSGVKRNDSDVLGLLRGAELFICDEAHHGATAESWQIVLGATSARRRIALSGTAMNTAESRHGLLPADPYDALLLGLFGDSVSLMPMSELIQIGAVAPLRIAVFPIEGDKLPSLWNWAKIFSVAITSNVPRSERIALLATNIAEMGYRPIISIEHLKQGRIIQEAMRRLGAAAVCAFGDDVFVVPRALRALWRGFEFRDIPKADKPLPLVRITNTGRSRVEEDFVSPLLERAGAADDFDKQTRELFEGGRFAALIGSRVYTEVVSMNFVTDIINAVGYHASKQIRQRWGRPARKYPGKTLATAWEPADDAHFYLAHQTKKRIGVALSEGLAVHPVVPVECWLRIRDLAAIIVSVKRHPVRIKEVEVSASLTVPIQARSGAVISITPRVSFTATMDDGDDERVVAEQLGVRATGALLREAERQAQWASEAATQGPGGAVKAFAASIAATPA